MKKEQQTRTEEDKVVQAPLVVVLGGKEYTIKPLVIKDSREWRKKFIEIIAPLPATIKATTKNKNEFEEALKLMLITMPGQVNDLFYQDAVLKELNWKRPS